MQAFFYRMFLETFLNSSSEETIQAVCNRVATVVRHLRTHPHSHFLLFPRAVVLHFIYWVYPTGVKLTKLS